MSKISPEVVTRLLDALAGDDDFRAEFERDPRAALRGLGHETPEHDLDVQGRDPVLPFLHLQGGLASKEKIAGGRDRLASAYRSADVTGLKALPFGPFDLCAD
jgi:putative modified peptide